MSNLSEEINLALFNNDTNTVKQILNSYLENTDNIEYSFNLIEQETNITPYIVENKDIDLLLYLIGKLYPYVPGIYSYFERTGPNLSKFSIMIDMIYGTHSYVTIDYAIEAAYEFISEFYPTQNYDLTWKFISNLDRYADRDYPLVRHIINKIYEMDPISVKEFIQGLVYYDEYTNDDSYDIETLMPNVIKALLLIDPEEFSNIQLLKIYNTAKYNAAYYNQEIEEMILTLANLRGYNILKSFI